MSDYFFLILNRDTMNQIVSNNLFLPIVELKKSYIGYNMGGLAKNAFAPRLLPSISTYLNTVKIRDSALGLSGFVSFFWWA